MKRRSAFLVPVLYVSLSVPLFAARPPYPPGGDLVVVDANNVSSYPLGSGTPRWTVGHPFNASPDSKVRILTFDGRSGPVVAVSGRLPDGSQHTVAFDAFTGQQLWENKGEVMLFAGDRYEDPIAYHLGPPDLNGNGEPEVLLIRTFTFTNRDTRVVDSRTGEVLHQWLQQAPWASRFIPGCDGTGYHILFSTDQGQMYVLDPSTNQQVWTYNATSRHGVAIGDIDGDGCPDIVAEPSYWSPTLLVLSGKTGNVIWQADYGSFDILGVLPVTPTEFILSAQLSNQGGVRRYNAATRAVVWDCPPTYNNQTIAGVLYSDNGMSVLSGWRHQRRAIAVDANTGNVLWAQPAFDADLPGFAVPDLSGDGNEDVILEDPAGTFSLYDGVSGTPVSWNPPALSGVWRGMHFNPYTYGPQVRLVRSGASSVDLQIDCPFAVAGGEFGIVLDPHLEVLDVEPGPALPQSAQFLVDLNPQRNCSNGEAPAQSRALTVGFVVSVQGTEVLAAGQHSIAKIHLRCRSSDVANPCPPGALRFVDCLGPAGGTVQNVVSDDQGNRHTAITNGVVVEIDDAFVRGDVNGDASLDISDAVFLFRYLFVGGTPPGCFDAADADDNGTLELTDGIYLLDWKFRGGAVPPPPSPLTAEPSKNCGIDPTEDDLRCTLYPPCRF